ncbi:C40 family peptidase [Rhodococcus sp. ACT016]|uniref:C40 family peptidase n=1 Tax=Rhodococcus sp. ACT016 TaxID=3134808 RepID=UPI003D2D15A4
MIDLLARPVVDLLGAFGSGALPGGSPADAMRAASDAIDAVHELGRVGISDLGGVWTGVAADAAIDKAQTTQAASVQLSDRGREIVVVVEAASETVRTGTAELQEILHSFLSLASSALPLLGTPAGVTMLIGAAVEHLGRALAVVERVRSELAVHTAKMVELTAPDPVPADARTVAASASAPAPAATTAAAVPAPVTPQTDAASRFVSAFAGSSVGSPMSSIDTASSARTASFDPGSGRASVETGSAGGSSSYDPRFGGCGVEILLPDGSTAVAPNQEAADAVRCALTQQGVPYQWGGTSPGQGLDCSGLTQWAYGEAGVDLPRLAQEQSVGIPVDQENLMPGDLAVWDGHVAMVVGNGQMIEAGDPVSVSAIRTSNIGMEFYGFYRPTE